MPGLARAVSARTCTPIGLPVGIGCLCILFGECPRRRPCMHYAILCYHSEDVVCSWTKEEDEAVMAKLAVVQGKLAKQGKLGPVVRLMPTAAATTLRKDSEPALVIDGPFAET